MPKGAMRILNAGKVQAEYNARKRAAAAAAAAADATKGDSEYRLSAAQKGKGKARDEDAQQHQSSEVAAASDLKIRPGEKLGDFNRRVEQAMASQVAASARSANRKLRKQRRAEREKEKTEKEEREEREAAAAKSKKRRTAGDIEDDGDGDDPAERSEPTSKELKRARQEYENRPAAPLDFAKADQRRRINDVAQAPPRLTKAPRGESKEALARKAKLAAALSGSVDPDEAARMVLSGNTRTVTKGQMPEPIAGLKRQKDLEDERDRVIKMYRKKKQAKIDARSGDE